MKQYISIFCSILVLLVLFVSGCMNKKENVFTDKNTQSVFPHQTKIKYSKGFSIDYFPGYKLVHVFTNWNEKDTVFRYVLLADSTPVPPGYEKAQIINTPVTSLICLSSLYTAYVNELKLHVQLVAVDDFNYINTPAIIRRISQGKIKEVGGGAALNIEKVMELDPGLIYTYGIGNPQYDSHPKLLEAGINVAVTVDHQETSPLGRAEWIKFMAVFFNKEKEADSIFNSIESNYNKIAAIGRKVKQKPTVLTELKYGDIWYMPGGNSYMAKLISDAGGDYLWAKDTHRGKLDLNFEHVYNIASEAEFWINVHDWKKLDDALANDVRNADFLAYKKGKIYNNNARTNNTGGNEYWETGLLHPEVVLADLLKIFHPELLPDHELVYYRRLD